MQRTIQLLQFFAFPALVFSAHLLGVKALNLYAFFPNIDIPFHFMGGASIAYTSAQLLFYLERENLTAPLNGFIFLVLLLSLTAMTAMFWEFAEFSMDYLLRTNVQVSLANTMQDQFLGLCGGVLCAALYAKKVLARHQDTSKC